LLVLNHEHVRVHGHHIFVGPGPHMFPRAFRSSQCIDSRAALLAAFGLGRGAYLDLQKWGIKPIVTDITDVETAIRAVLDDTIINHVDELH
jgi:hypothetical protein